MKKILLFALLGFFAFSVKAQENKAVDPDAPVMKFEKTTFDYGVIDKGSDGMCEFKFTNTGKSPLKILRVKSTCGCTIPTYPKADIMPGEEAVIHVKYDTHKVGRFSKSVSIFTNTTPERTVLRIKGEVVDPNKPGPIKKDKNILEIE